MRIFNLKNYVYISYKSSDPITCVKWPGWKDKYVVTLSSVGDVGSKVIWRWRSASNTIYHQIFRLIGRFLYAILTYLWNVNRRVAVAEWFITWTAVQEDRGSNPETLYILREFRYLLFWWKRLPLEFESIFFQFICVDFFVVIKKAVELITFICWILLESGYGRWKVVSSIKLMMYKPLKIIS